jgi:hypothetical protein
MTVEGGRGAIKERTAQIKKRTAQRLAKKVSMMGVADNRAGSGWQSREGRKNQPLMGAVQASSGWQWQEWEDSGWEWWQKGAAAGGGIAVAKDEWSWHQWWQRHLGSGQQRCVWLRVAASRRIDLSFGSGCSYCSDGNITWRWKYKWLSKIMLLFL